MKKIKNEKTETSNGTIHGNDNSSQAHARDFLQELNPNSVASEKYGTFDFGINQEFIQEEHKK